MWSIIERTHIKVSDNYRVNSPLYIHGIVLWLFLPYLKKKQETFYDNQESKSVHKTLHVVKYCLKLKCIDFINYQ